jgi:hypothetical protein
MKMILTLFAILGLTCGSVWAQKNVLVVEKSGNVRSFKYFEGDKIEVHTTDSLELKGMITAIKDSSFVLDFYTEVSLSKVKTVLRTRWAISIISKVLMIGGAGLVIIEAVNGAISSNGSMNENSLYIGAATAAAGALLIPWQKARFDILSAEWKIKILKTEQDHNYQKNKTIRF